MAVYRRSSRTRNVLLVLVLAAVTLVTIDARSNGSGLLSQLRGKVSDAFAPVQSATHTVLAPIGDFLTGAADYGSLRRENQRLRQQLASLQTARARAAAEEQQAGQVLQQAGLPFVGAIPTVEAQIVDQGSSNFDNTLTIGKGTASGVAAGEPVVAAGGLVGSVLSVTAHTATVRLVTDPSFTVGVVLPNDNVGAATGEGRDQPMHVVVETPQKPAPDQAPAGLPVGTVLVTSGLANEKFPKGIPVGRVKRADKPTGAAEPDVTVTPLVDPSRLSYLEVLLWSPQP